MATSQNSEPLPAPKTAGPPRRPRLVLWLKRAGVVLAALIAVAAITVFLVIRHYEADLPSIAEVKSYNPQQVTRVLARDGTVLGELFVERRTLVSIDDIPSAMKLAVLAAED